MGRVYVFGSINMDIVAFARRRPGVGETVTGDELRLLPGGKGANQAVAARRAGADTALAGRVGDDPFAADLLRFLEAEGVELSLTCSLAGETSGTALIVVAEADNAIVVVPGANARLGLEAVQAAPIAAGDIVVAQFETPQKTTLAAFEKAAGVGATTILNPAPAATVAAGLLETSDIVVLNALELGELLGTPLPAAGLVAWAGRYGDALRMRGDQAIVVTLGAGGVVACSEGDPLHIVGKPVPTIDTTGAGDCFVGNLAAALLRGDTLRDAAGVANAAAALCVQARGAAASMPRWEVRDRRHAPA
jgi:ribokinase